MTESRGQLLRAVRRGFARVPKELSPRWLYDERGSQLFAQITRVPEYYLTRAERQLLTRVAPALGARRVHTLVELGAGSAEKTRVLLHWLLPGSCYRPVDISVEYLERTAAQLRAEFPQLSVEPLAADMTRLPDAVQRADGPVLFALLGSTIGNFRPRAAERLLSAIRGQLCPGDLLLLGADLVKRPAVLEAAYNDARGITAEFNLNLLCRLNRELGTDFDRAGFRHLAYYDGRRERIEMHLLSLREQLVGVPGWQSIRIARGETIRTEVSCKYTRSSLTRLLRASGLAPTQWYVDRTNRYVVLLAEPVATSVRVRSPRAAALAPMPAPQLVADAAAWIAERLLPRPVERPRIGAEYELLVQEEETHAPAAWRDGNGPLAHWLAAHAAAHGWARVPSCKGAPKYRLPGGGTVTLEPGGQLEYATSPHAHPDRLLDDLRGCIGPLEASAREHGLVLLAAGIDPHNVLADSPLQLHSLRYQRMSEYFARLGPAGAMMMRQTASLQLNLDVREDVAGTWRLVNALAPYLLALWGNSARYAGVNTGLHSCRATLWRRLDPQRTGLFPCREQPAVEYARFALRAPLMLHRGILPGPVAQDPERWEEHLSTLFPEVRLRGYLELRTPDSLPLSAAADLVHFVAALCWNRDAREAALAVVGAPDPVLLNAAGEDGMKNESLRQGAERLVEIARSAGAPLASRAGPVAAAG